MAFLRKAYEVSIRRACAVLCASRSSYHYRSGRSGQAVLRKRIREIAETRVRYGYRRIHVLLRREGWRINHKRTYRLYCEEGLQMRNKTPKRRVSAKLRDDRRPATAANECWAMDFMADQLFSGRRIRVLTIVDIFSKVSPAIGVGATYKGHDVVATLELAVQNHGCPKRIRVDNGPEFISRDLDLWAYSNGVVLDFSRPHARQAMLASPKGGKPTDNAYIEAFNSRFRQECLNASWFLSLEDARSKIETWRVEYNNVRPHTAIGHLTPAEFAASSGQACLA